MTDPRSALGDSVGSSDATSPHLVPAPAFGAPRLSVRRRRPDGSVADVVGHVIERRSDATLLLPHEGPAVMVADADVVARREVPPRATRPTSSADDLERLAAGGWPGLEAARLGGWLLRAGAGWTNRANSCLVAGDPGVDPGLAVEVVLAHYGARGVTPRFQFVGPTGEPVLRATGRTPQATAVADTYARLRDAGWVAHDETLFLVADLRRLDLDTHAAEEASAARFSDRPDAAWLGVYRSGEGVRLRAVERVLAAAEAQYVTLSADAGAMAVARLVRTVDWAGLAAVEVAPGARGLGLGRRVTVDALRRARDDGARFAYLQVGTDNAVARTLYDSLGFGVHHHYHYLRPGTKTDAPHGAGAGRDAT